MEYTTVGATVKLFVRKNPNPVARATDILNICMSYYNLMFELFEVHVYLDGVVYFDCIAIA